MTFKGAHGDQQLILHFNGVGEGSGAPEAAEGAEELSLEKRKLRGDIITF